MRKKYYLMALTGLLLASCSEENDPFGPDGGQVPVSGRELTFVFPGTAQGVVPYAVTALPAENELKTLDIYVFGEDSMQAAKPMLLEEIYRSGVAGDGSAGDSKGYTLSTSGSDKTAKISVPAGNNKAFFFVANAREHLSLDSVELHVTDTAAFKSKLSNTLKGLIACPMLMSGQKDLPDVSTAIAGGAAVDIELTRRVARFDIKNNSETSNFVIGKVALANVPANVPLFPKSGYVAPFVEKMPLIDFSAMENSNAGVTNSVFYLYPVDMTTGKEVAFSLTGTNLVTSAPQVLDVEFKEYKSGNVIDIEANNRYLVEVEDLGSGELAATLRVMEWLVGDTVNVNTGNGTIRLSSEAAGFADNTLPVAAEPTLADSVAIMVAADGEWELIVEDQYKSWLGVSELPGDTVLKTFKVTTLLPNPSSKEERQGVVIVQNVNRPSIRQPLIVKQAAQDPATGRFLDISGAAVAGNLLSFSGEMTTGDSLNVKVGAPAGTGWTATKTATATWFKFGKEALLKAGAGTTDGTTFAGEGEETFSIVPDQNSTDQERVDTVTITIAQAGELKTDLIQKLIVRQAAQNLGSITVKCIGLSAGNVAVAAAGFPDSEKDGEGVETHVGERKVTVNATTEWKVIIPTEATWLTQEGEITLVPQSKNGSFYLKAAANTAPDAEVRSAVVRIENTQKSTIYQEITFVQAADPQAPVDALELAATTLEWTNSESGAKTIDVTTASSDWTLTNVPAWLTATATTGGVDTDIELTPKTEGLTIPFFEDKTATIDVTVGSETKQITVTWKAETVTLSAVAPATIAVAGNAGSPVDVAVTCNDAENWSASAEDGADWLTVSKNGANVEVAAAEYIGGSANRSATVTIISTSQPSVTTTFTVTQAFE